MRVDPVYLWVFLASACAIVATGTVLLRFPRLRIIGWVFLAGGLAAVALQAFAHFAGRLGLDQLWFRAPTFYVATAILLGASLWWLSRPAPRGLRFGLPALLLGLTLVAGVLTRVDGRSVPLAMLMPTRNQLALELRYFDATGKLQRLSDLRGKTVLLNFWATWCAPCRREMPLLSQMQREYAQQGLVVLYVSLEEPAVLDAFLSTNHFDGLHGRLDRADDFYDAGKYYPLSYLIDADGRVIQRWSGRPREDWLRAELARTG